MNRGTALMLLAGCTGEPGEKTYAPPADTASTSAACAVTADEMIGWDDEALGSTPSALFVQGTGLFAGELDAADGPLAITLEVDPDLGEIHSITRAWEGEGELTLPCASTVEVAFAARLVTPEAAVDAAFTAVMISDGEAVEFVADLPASEADDAFSAYATGDALAISADLGPPGVWSGWLTWGSTLEAAAWFEVSAAAH